MIQRIASFRALGCALLFPMLTPGCGRGLPHTVVRTLDGNTAHGAFVPPYAYEAYVRGELALMRGEPAAAVAQFELAATAPEEDPFLLSRLAYAQLESGDRAGAANTLEHASELDPCSEAVWLMRGRLAESSQELERARAAYQNASACAPNSPRGELALVRQLQREGKAAEAMDVLLHAAEHRDGKRPVANSALRSSLESADAATLAHAFDSMAAQRALDASTLESAIRLALDRGLPRLALRLSEQHPSALPTELQARLLSANQLRERLAALLAASDSAALGGHERTAELALQAHAYERAELEASSAIQAHDSEAMRAIRARAALAQGHARAALSDLRAVKEPELQRELLQEALGLTESALAREIDAWKR